MKTITTCLGLLIGLTSIAQLQWKIHKSAFSASLISNMVQVGDWTILEEAQGGTYHHRTRLNGYNSKWEKKYSIKVSEWGAAVKGYYPRYAGMFAFNHGCYIVYFSFDSKTMTNHVYLGEINPSNGKLKSEFKDIGQFYGERHMNFFEPLLSPDGGKIALVATLKGREYNSRLQRMSKWDLVKDKSYDEHQIKPQIIVLDTLLNTLWISNNQIQHDPFLRGLPNVIFDGTHIYFLETRILSFELASYAYTFHDRYPESYVSIIHKIDGNSHEQYKYYADPDKIPDMPQIGMKGDDMYLFVPYREGNDVSELTVRIIDKKELETVSESLLSLESKFENIRGPKKEKRNLQFHYLFHDIQFVENKIYAHLEQVRFTDRYSANGPIMKAHAGGMVVIEMDLELNKTNEFQVKRYIAGEITGPSLISHSFSDKKGLCVLQVDPIKPKRSNVKGNCGLFSTYLYRFSNGNMTKTLLIDGRARRVHFYPALTFIQKGEACYITGFNKPKRLHFCDLKPILDL